MCDPARKKMKHTSFHVLIFYQERCCLGEHQYVWYKAIFWQTGNLRYTMQVTILTRVGYIVFVFVFVFEFCIWMVGYIVFVFVFVFEFCTWMVGYIVFVFVLVFEFCIYVWFDKLQSSERQDICDIPC